MTLSILWNIILTFNISQWNHFFVCWKLIRCPFINENTWRNWSDTYCALIICLTKVNHIDVHFCTAKGWTNICRSSFFIYIMIRKPIEDFIHNSDPLQDSKTAQANLSRHIFDNKEYWKSCVVFKYQSHHRENPIRVLSSILIIDRYHQNIATRDTLQKERRYEMIQGNI